MKKTILFACLLLLLAGCSNEKLDDTKGNIQESTNQKDDSSNAENKSQVTYTSGIKNIDDALKYELGLWFSDDGISEDYGMNTVNRVITSTTKNVKASDLKESMLTEHVYQYLESQNKFDINKVYSEEEVKDVLTELYGTNYTYTKPLKDKSGCASLAYDSNKGGYTMEGGCGGIIFPSEPHIMIKILENKDPEITVGRVYIVPSRGSDEFEAAPPYEVYKNEDKKEKIGTVNDPNEIFTTLADKVERYKITFDKENGYYHFNNITKIN